MKGMKWGVCICLIPSASAISVIYIWYYLYYPESGIFNDCFQRFQESAPHAQRDPVEMEQRVFARAKSREE
jgi:hypothetical protein